MVFECLEFYQWSVTNGILLNSPLLISSLLFFSPPPRTPHARDKSHLHPLLTQLRTPMKYRWTFSAPISKLVSLSPWRFPGKQRSRRWWLSSRPHGICPWSSSNSLSTATKWIPSRHLRNWIWRTAIALTLASWNQFYPLDMSATMFWGFCEIYTCVIGVPGTKCDFNEFCLFHATGMICYSLIFVISTVIPTINAQIYLWHAWYGRLRLKIRS